MTYTVALTGTFESCRCNSKFEGTLEQENVTAQTPEEAFKNAVYQLRSECIKTLEVHHAVVETDDMLQVILLPNELLLTLAINLNIYFE